MNSFQFLHIIRFQPKMTANVNLFRSIYFQFHLLNVFSASQLRWMLQKGQVRQRKQVTAKQIVILLLQMSSDSLLTESSHQLYLTNRLMILTLKNIHKMHEISEQFEIPEAVMKWPIYYKLFAFKYNQMCLMILEIAQLKSTAIIMV